MSKQIEDAIEAAVEAIINARDFCGNEREAAMEAFQDEGVKPNKSLLDAAFERANAEWDEQRAKAGVTRPMTVAEYEVIYKELGV